MKRTIGFIGLGLLVASIFFLPPPAAQHARNAFFSAASPFWALFQGAADRVFFISRLHTLDDENALLKTRMENFKRLAFEHNELKLENDRLRELLNFKRLAASGVKKAIPCQVVGRSPAGWREAILLDRGSEEGIQVDMPVMTYSGLLGRVAETSAHAAKVKLITHPRFRIGALIQRTRHTGVVYGTADGECRMKYIALDADVKQGDIVETAGFSERFPKSLLIGTIDAVWREPGQLYRVASIRLAADIDRLEEVLCVIP